MNSSVQLKKICVSPIINKRVIGIILKLRRGGGGGGGVCEKKLKQDCRVVLSYLYHFQPLSTALIGSYVICLSKISSYGQRQVHDIRSLIYTLPLL